MINCDPTTGACQLPPLGDSLPNTQPSAIILTTVHYIGDPMCSWCWGISPAVAEIESYCAENGIGFSVTVGGLRAGGGDPWDDWFRNFLRNEWEHIARVTGQPFGFTLLDRVRFHYDTEPACRAVVAVQQIQKLQSLPTTLPRSFFSSVQQKFYVQGKDPKEPKFYESICQSLQIDYPEFLNRFESAQTRAATHEEFQKCRSWGVASFPTLLLQQGDKLSPLAAGFTTAQAVLATLQLATGKK